jgi:transglutaminase-like putative cysteine protease
VVLHGVDLNTLALSGGRQSLTGNVLTITRETLPTPTVPEKAADLPPAMRPYLQPSLLVQSDHPAIRAQAAAITADAGSPSAQLQAIVDWMRAHIERRPVLSMPDALTTLSLRQGDCNEYAALTAALARAAGLPATIEAGLVYLDGRFFYHAWNRVYVGQWITVDALFGRIPADVTHIRLVEGEQDAQVDLLPLMGKLSLQILDSDESTAD